MHRVYSGRTDKITHVLATIGCSDAPSDQTLTIFRPSISRRTSLEAHATTHATHASCMSRLSPQEDIGEDDRLQHDDWCKTETTSCCCKACSSQTLPCFRVTTNPIRIDTDRMGYQAPKINKWHGISPSSYHQCCCCCSCNLPILAPIVYPHQVFAAYNIHSSPTYQRDHGTLCHNGTPSHGSDDPTLATPCEIVHCHCVCPTRASRLATGELTPLIRISL